VDDGGWRWAHNAPGHPRWPPDHARPPASPLRHHAGAADAALGAIARLEQSPALRARYFAREHARFIEVSQQFPPPAPPYLARPRRRARVVTEFLGFRARHKPTRLAKPWVSMRTDFPRDGWPSLLRYRPSEWWHLTPDWLRDRPRSLNTDYMIQLCHRHLEPAKAAYMVLNYIRGFPDPLRAPPYSQALTGNGISPGGPGADGVNAQPPRLAKRGLVWTPPPGRGYESTAAGSGRQDQAERGAQGAPDGRR